MRLFNRRVVSGLARLVLGNETAVLRMGNEQIVVIGVPMHFSLIQQDNWIGAFDILKLMRRQDARFALQVPLQAFLEQMLTHVSVNL